MQNSFFNTTNETGETLKGYDIKAATQEELVMQFFLNHPGDLFTPHDIHNHLNEGNTPVTSYRRAMSNLTKLELLEKTKLKVDGEYGRSCYTWKLAKKDEN